MEKKTVRWGILGCSGIGKSRTIPGLLACENAELYAIAGRNEEKLKAYAEPFAPKKLYTDYQALLDDENVDAVYLPLPNGIHMEWVEKAAKAGKHILCEKPMALTEEQVREMFAAAKADGIELVARSAYRSTQEQTTLFNSMKQDYINQGMSEEEAFAATKQWRNEPGTSEHETGLAVDIVGAADINAALVESLEERDWAVWLREHAPEYGFILRYMKDKTDITGTSFEPWHYRYVGVEDAQKITAQGVCLEEYLGRTE